jgi:hypothetical protein
MIGAAQVAWQPAAGPSHAYAHLQEFKARLAQQLSLGDNNRVLAFKSSVCSLTRGHLGLSFSLPPAITLHAFTLRL